MRVESHYLNSIKKEYTINGVLEEEYEYIVNKRNQEIKTGRYKKYYGATIAEEGFYVTGIKNGFIKIYSINGVLEEYGHYENGFKSGLWIKKDRYNKMEKKYIMKMEMKWN